MEIQPAHVDQLTRSRNGDWVVIPAEAGGVAADLQAIDESLRVRLNERNGVFVVFTRTEDAEGRTKDDLVLTHQGTLNSFGVWEGLHAGIVDRVREIDAQGSSGYDFAREVEAQNERAHERRRSEFREKVAPYGERAAHAVRRDLGLRYKGRAFKPRNVG